MGDVTTTPAADPDAGKYEDLRNELGIEAAPVAEPGAEPEPQAPAAEPEPPKPEHVPFSEHENVQRALREARAQQKASDERFAQLMRVIEQSRTREPDPKKDDKPALPAKEEDPIGYFEGRIGQLEAALTEARQGSQHATQDVQALHERQQIDALIEHSERDIRNPASQAHKADYDDAIQHIRATRVAELNLMYPDDSQVAQHIAQQQGFRSVADLKNAIFANDADQVTRQALALGIPPAQFYYEVAKGRGYMPKAAGKVPAGQNGKSLAEQAKAQLDTAKRGQKAAVSISGGSSGRKGAEDLSVADLADLFIEDPEMADKIWDQMARAGKLG
ncbi:MAG TPA: hypothetical protein VG758_18575 [Hyphomicrobiaceae bacterium]|jgi:hypothetical protein|nr:hypothetical protein [Hyphomicrobiaceae bacterium]